MDDSQVMLQVLNNMIQRNIKKFQDYEIEIANYMTSLLRLEARVVALEEKNAEYLEIIERVSKKEEDKK